MTPVDAQRQTRLRYPQLLGRITSIWSLPDRPTRLVLLRFFHPRDLVNVCSAPA